MSAAAGISLPGLLFLIGIKYILQIADICEGHDFWLHVDMNTPVSVLHRVAVSLSIVCLRHDGVMKWEKPAAGYQWYQGSRSYE